MRLLLPLLCLQLMPRMLLSVCQLKLLVLLLKLALLLQRLLKKLLLLHRHCLKWY